MRLSDSCSLSLSLKQLLQADMSLLAVGCQHSIEVTEDKGPEEGGEAP